MLLVHILWHLGLKNFIKYYPNCDNFFRNFACFLISFIEKHLQFVTIKNRRYRPGYELPCLFTFFFSFLFVILLYMFLPPPCPAVIPLLLPHTPIPAFLSLSTLSHLFSIPSFSLFLPILPLSLTFLAVARSPVEWGEISCLYVCLNASSTFCESLGPSQVQGPFLTTVESRYNGTASDRNQLLTDAILKSQARFFFIYRNDKN